MALITSPDVLPEAMRYLLRAVLAHNGARCERSDLLLLVAPEGLPEAMKQLDRDSADNGDGENTAASGKLIATASLTALTTLRLVTVEGQEVVATETARSHWRTATSVSADSFSRILRAQVWQAASTDADANPDSRVDDLVDGLAVLFASREPLRPFEFEDNPGRRFDLAQTEWFGTDKSNWPVTNDVQFRPFYRLAAYLGYAQFVDTKSIVADASRALLSDLGALPSGRLRWTDFLARVAETMPISDGGPRSLWKPDDAREISPGMSISLSQLEASGHLSLPPAESDADSMVITLGKHVETRLVSHIVWHPRTTAKDHS